MKKRCIAVGLGLATSAGSSAFALETLKSYDKFSSAPIDGSRWLTGETSLQVKRGQLVVSERLYSSRASDSGEHFDILRIPVPDPAAVTEMKATITVNALEVNACETNSIAGSSRARVAGAFFNAGTPVAGSSVDDVLGQARVIRFGNSTDPAGVLRL